MTNFGSVILAYTTPVVQAVSIMDFCNDSSMLYGQIGCADSVYGVGEGHGSIGELYDDPGRINCVRDHIELLRTERYCSSVQLPQLRRQQ